MAEFYRNWGKRTVDIVGSAVLLLVTLPIQAVIAVAAAAVHGRPVLFEQDRPGRGSEIFRLRKFRSMRPERYAGEPDADRLDWFGRFLRATSLDELPTLWNVLGGEMSLVGPRPLRVHYLPLYSAEQARRHEVRPGVTGLAQVRGRNLLSWEERFTLDVYYVDHRSLKLDFTILAQTIITVLTRTGVSAQGHVTMEPFVGVEK